MLLPASSEYNTRTRPKPLTFYAPKTSPFWIAVCKLGLRRSIRRRLNVTKIEISPDDLALLKRLAGQRCLLTPSHSGGYEPHIMMYLSKLTGHIYHFVAAVEVFEQAPINRWLMPRLGVYSIIRGAVDRQSFATTRQLLAEGRRPLVIFPEGHAILQNSTIAPFQEGVIQLAFKAYEDARTADPDANLFCIPIAIKYTYLQDMQSEIDESLDKLEEALAIRTSPNSDPSPSRLPRGRGQGEGALSRYIRLRRIAEAVLVANEKAHGVKAPAPDSDSHASSMDARIQNLKSLVTSKYERQLGITPNDRQSLLDRIRALFVVVDRVVHEGPPGNEYGRRLALECQQMARTLCDDLWRLLQFVAIYDGYVRESMTVERFMDVLGLLELEVFQTRRVWGPRKATIKLGAPINLKDHAAAYDENKRGAVQAVNATLESEVRKNLEAMEAACALVRE
jgi:1-acyl-sn-glycerol-3-phosphate acyltransferase